MLPQKSRSSDQYLVVWVSLLGATSENLLVNSYAKTRIVLSAQTVTRSQVNVQSQWTEHLTYIWMTKIIRPRRTRILTFPSLHLYHQSLKQYLIFLHRNIMFRSMFLILWWTPLRVTTPYNRNHQHYWTPSQILQRSIPKINRRKSMPYAGLPDTVHPQKVW